MPNAFLKKADILNKYKLGQNSTDCSFIFSGVIFIVAKLQPQSRRHLHMHVMLLTRVSFCAVRLPPVLEAPQLREA